MFIPVGVPVEIATSAVVGANTGPPSGVVIATFRTPFACDSGSMQVSMGEPHDLNGVGVTLALMGGLDGDNYPFSFCGAVVGGSSLIGDGGVISAYPQQLFQLIAYNTDDIDHTVSVWVLLK